MKTKTFFFLVLTIFCIHVCAQPAVRKQRAYNGPGSTLLGDMKFTYDGGLILASLSYSDKGKDKSQNNRDTTGSSADYWLIKTDSAGKIQWEKTMGGKSYEVATAVCTARDHGYLIGGYSTSGADHEKTQYGRGENDFWIVKLDSMGNIQWDKTIGGNKEDQLRSMDTALDGGYILGGFSASGISGDKTSSLLGAGSYWILKLDTAGNIQWDKTVGGSGGGSLVKIKHTADGGYIAGGTSSSGISGDKTEASRGGQDYWVVKLDASGNIEWDKTIGGADEYENLADLVQTFDGGYIAGGLSASNISGDKTENSRGAAYDYWFVKLDNKGAIQWDKTLGGKSGDYLATMVQTKDSGLIAAGFSYSDVSGDKTEPLRNKRGYNDNWVVKLNKHGTLEWDKTIGGNFTDQPVTILQYNENSFIIGGGSDSPVSDDKTIPLKGTFDIWLTQLTNQKPAHAIVTAGLQPLQLQQVVPGDSHFTAYPNPAKNIIHIQSSGKSSFSLSNQSGKTVLTKTITGNGQMNVAQLPAGIYYLQNDVTGARRKVLVE